MSFSPAAQTSSNSNMDADSFGYSFRYWRFQDLHWHGSNPEIIFSLREMRKRKGVRKRQHHGYQEVPGSACS
jgi:hypothetical protein